MATLREAAKQDTRQALIAAGLSEILEHGLDIPSLDAICARAGFTRGAFYVHFRDRDDFVVAVMETVLGQFFDAVIATGEAANDLTETVDRFATALASGSMPWSFGGSVRAYHLIDVCTRSPAIRQRFVAMVAEAVGRVGQAAREGQTAGTVRTDVPPEQAGILLAALAFGLISLSDAGVPIAIEPLREAVRNILTPPAPHPKKGTTRTRRSKS